MRCASCVHSHKWLFETESLCLVVFEDCFVVKEIRSEGVSCEHTILNISSIIPHMSICSAEMLYFFLFSMLCLHSA